jgi:glycoside/pentoside/hexuronide:cation symporter, GPH family
VLPALCLGALALPLTIYLPVYYSGYVGLGLSVVGFTFFLVRTLDIGVDPLMGWILDRTRTRWGQCRPWMVAGSALMTIGVVMLFFAPPGSGAVRLALGLLVLYAGTSVLGVAQPAWAARLAPDYNQRSHLYAWVQLASSAGTFILLGLPTLAGILGKPGPGAEVHVMGVLLAITLPVGVVVALWRVPEPAVPPAHRGAPDRVRLTDYVTLLRRSNIARLVFADLFVSLGTGTSSVLFLFFWNAARGYTTAQTGVIILVYYFAAVVSVPAWIGVVRRVGKQRAFLLSSMGFVVIMPVMAFMPRARLDIVLPVMALLGLLFGAPTFLIRAMAADAADEARLNLGVDRLGQIYGLLASTTKLAAALAVGATFIVLDKVGFKAPLGAHNPRAVLMTLQWMYIAAPASATLIGLAGFLGYRLDRETHDRVRGALAARDAMAVAAPES